MGVRAAVLELQRATDELQTRLQALADLAQDAGGGGVHKLIDQVDLSAVEALAAVEAAQAAVGRAAAPGAAAGAVRDALTEAQDALDQLRRKAARRLRGRVLAENLDDLAGRGRKGPGLKAAAAWAADTRPLLRGVREALRRADAAAAACWREVAAAPSRRVTVRTETVVE